MLCFSLTIAQGFFVNKCERFFRLQAPQTCVVIAASTAARSLVSCVKAGYVRLHYLVIITLKN